MPVAFLAISAAKDRRHGTTCCSTTSSGSVHRHFTLVRSAPLQCLTASLGTSPVLPNAPVGFCRPPMTSSAGLGLRIVRAAPLAMWIAPDTERTTRTTDGVVAGRVGREGRENTSPLFFSTRAYARGRRS